MIPPLLAVFNVVSMQRMPSTNISWPLETMRK